MSVQSSNLDDQSSSSSLTPLPSTFELVYIDPNLQCLVCGELVVHLHFGKRTCNSCAAFFRRSVSHRKRYVCRQNQACNINKKRHKNRCAFCRFERCLGIGMDMGGVIDNNTSLLKESGESMLSRLRFWHRGTFMCRRRYYIEMYGLQNFTSSWELPRDANSFLRTSFVESYVMRDFLRNSGIIQVNHIWTEFETTICSGVFFMWMLLEFIFQTRLHGGQRSKRVYYVDDSYLQFNEDVVFDYFRNHPCITSPSVLSKCAMPAMQSVLNTTEQIHNLHIDDHEKMAIILICILNKAKRNVPIPNVQEWMNLLFEDLNSHYKNTYNNITRLDQIMTCVSAIESTHQMQLQQIAVIKLDYRETNSIGYDCYSAQLFSRRQ